MDQDTLAKLGGELREGQRVRVSHGCGEGKTMLVSREGAQVRGWCFRCNEPMRADLRLSTHDNLYRVRESLRAGAEAKYERSVERPGPLLPFEQWPPAARLWLLRAGMAGAACDRMGAGWHEEMQRVVLPLRDAAGRDVSWTARSVDHRTPKYLTGFLPEGFVAEAGREGDTPPVCVEDWLSANKLGMAGAHSVCMLGTILKSATLARLLTFKEVFVWGDNDTPDKGHKTNWGQVMAMRAVRTLRAYGIRVHNVVSDLDPKLMDRASIQRELARCATGPTP